MLAKMKITSKIWAGFSLAVVVSAAVGLVGYLGTQRITGHLSLIADARFPSALAVTDFTEGMNRVSRGLNLLLIRRLGTNEYHQAGYEYVEKGLKSVEDAKRAFDSLPHTEAALAIWRNVTEPEGEWERAVKQLVEAQRELDRMVSGGKAADSPEAQKLDAEVLERWIAVRKIVPAVQKPLAEELEVTRKVVTQERESAFASATTMSVTLVVVIVLGAVVLIVLGFYMARDIGSVFRGIGGYLDRMAKGDLPPKITESRGEDLNALRDSLNTCTEAVRALIADAHALSEAAVQGRLDTRAEAGRFQGDYKKIIQGVNDTLDAVIAPMREISAVLEKLAAGNLSARTDPTRYHSEARALVEGVNKTLDVLLAPGEEAASVLGKLAARDLRARMSGSYEGEHAKLKDAVNSTASALHDALAQVAQAVEQVSAASSQIASSSQAVASGASEQASSLEETGSSLESMSSMTKQSADNAQQASALAGRAKAAASAGSTATAEMTAAMAKIKASAEGTSQIIKDINEIAFQTNLLALNAAVEAARAGEAGRGFAVVAEEVRSLALRSKEAANKTEELIRQSVNEAGGGEETAKEVNDKLSEIVASVSKVTDIVSEISASAKEQATGIEQVTMAMNQMNTVTQQNAASSEESSSAAAELSGQAEELAAMVGAFQLDGVAVKRKVVAKASPVPTRKLVAKAKGGQVGMAARPDLVIPLDDESSLREF